MRLKLKITDGRLKYCLHVDNEELQNYGQLRGEIAAVLDTGAPFDLSLNYGKDFLAADDDTTLSDLGLVSGDVLTVVVHSDVLNTSGVMETRVFETTADNVITAVNTIPQPQKKFKSSCDMKVDYMSQITLCRESVPGAIPLKLERLYRTQPVESKFDALVLVLHRLMREVGFVQVEVDGPAPLLAQWKTTNEVYKMKYYSPDCPLSASCPTNCCQLVCVVLSENILTVHAVICDGPSKDTIMNMTVPCYRYLKISPTIKLDPTHVYQDLPHLSCWFKDDIALPLLNILRTDAQMPTKSDFTSLPVELKRLILNNLNSRCLTMMSGACSELHELCNDDIFWKRCFAREYPNCKLPASVNTTWKKRYIEAYKAACEQEKERKRLMEELKSYDKQMELLVRGLHPPVPRERLRRERADQQWLVRWLQGHDLPL